MNNMSTSECSSGCESGWTMYLDQSSNSGDEGCHHRGGGGVYNGKRPNVGVEQAQHDEEDDEDLSMVSDASSGPRQHYQQPFHDVEEEEEQQQQQQQEQQGDNSCDDHLGSSAPEHRIKPTKTRLHKLKQKSSYFLDDTASSPVFTNSKGKSGFQKHFGFLKKPSSVSAGKTAASEKSSGGLQGRKRQ